MEEGGRFSGSRIRSVVVLEKTAEGAQICRRTPGHTVANCPADGTDRNIWKGIHGRKKEKLWCRVVESGGISMSNPGTLLFHLLNNRVTPPPPPPSPASPLRVFVCKYSGMCSESLTGKFSRIAHILVCNISSAPDVLLRPNLLLLFLDAAGPGGGVAWKGKGGQLKVTDRERQMLMPKDGRTG